MQKCYVGRHDICYLPLHYVLWAPVLKSTQVHDEFGGFLNENDTTALSLQDYFVIIERGSHDQYLLRPCLSILSVSFIQLTVKSLLKHHQCRTQTNCYCSSLLTDWVATIHTAPPTTTGSPSHSLAYVGSVIWATHVS